MRLKNGDAVCEAIAVFAVGRLDNLGCEVAEKLGLIHLANRVHHDMPSSDISTVEQIKP